MSTLSFIFQGVISFVFLSSEGTATIFMSYYLILQKKDKNSKDSCSGQVSSAAVKAFLARQNAEKAKQKGKCGLLK